ncbi:MAG: hypothetical protein R2709_14450 [Marmoricola sp.]
MADGEDAVYTAIRWMACWSHSWLVWQAPDDLDSVHPLLFEIDGEIYPVEPQAKMPVDVTKGHQTWRSMSIIEAWLRPR